MNKFAPLFPKVAALLHGADYNPEQWENYPGIIENDISMMQQAKCNVMSVGIFSWAKLEPREGEYDFAWLDSIIEKLYAAGIHIFLATPSGARPAWMSQKYPEPHPAARPDALYPAQTQATHAATPGCTDGAGRGRYRANFPSGMGHRLRAYAGTRSQTGHRG
jgi:hypothetical protein